MSKKVVQKAAEATDDLVDKNATNKTIKIGSNNQKMLRKYLKIIRNSLEFLKSIKNYKLVNWW